MKPFIITMLFALACGALPAAANDDAGAPVKPIKPVKIETLLKTTTDWSGAPLPAYPTGAPEVTLLKITVAPNVKLPAHLHPYINVGVILSGEIQVVAESGETKRFAAGDALAELTGKWHYGENASDKPAELLVFYVGEKNKPHTIAKE